MVAELRTSSGKVKGDFALNALKSTKKSPP
jgi:hypothetical protein